MSKKCCMAGGGYQLYRSSQIQKDKQKVAKDFNFIPNQDYCIWGGVRNKLECQRNCQFLDVNSPNWDECLQWEKMDNNKAHEFIHYFYGPKYDIPKFLNIRNGR